MFSSALALAVTRRRISDGSLAPVPSRFELSRRMPIERMGDPCPGAERLEPTVRGGEDGFRGQALVPLDWMA